MPNGAPEVFATVQGEAVVKRLARENGTIRLESGLPDEPAIVPEDGSLIVGRVSLVVRSL
jgi:SOS-response transcriptional repressor LexA